MRLKLQMLVAGLVTLAIPVVGWHSIRQLDDALEESRRQEQQLRVKNALSSLEKNDRLIRVLEQRNLASQPSDLDAPRARFPIFIDGYFDDWRELSVPAQQLPTTATDVEVSAKLSMRVAMRDNKLFMFVEVSDDTVLFHRPPPLVADYGEGEEPDLYEQLVNGDALEVWVQESTGYATHGLFRASAPGPLVARRASDSPNARIGDRIGAWQGHWSTTTDGFQLEISFPLPEDNATLGVAYVDVDSRGDQRQHWVGNFDPKELSLIHISEPTRPY